MTNPTFTLNKTNHFTPAPNSDDNGNQFVSVFVFVPKDGSTYDKWQIRVDFDYDTNGNPTSAITSAGGVVPIKDIVDIGTYGTQTINLNKVVKVVAKGFTTTTPGRLANKSGWGSIEGKSKKGFAVSDVSWHQPVSTNLFD